MNDEDKVILQYLRNSPKDSLKKEAADLIQRQSDEIATLKEKIMGLASKCKCNNG